MSFYTSNLVDLTNSLSKFLQIDLDPSDTFQAKPTKSSHPNSPIQIPQRKKIKHLEIHGHLPYVLRLKKKTEPPHSWVGAMEQCQPLAINLEPKKTYKTRSIWRKRTKTKNDLAFPKRNVFFLI